MSGPGLPSLRACGGRALTLAAALTIALLAPGCVVLELMQAQRAQRVEAQFALVSGTVDFEDSEDTWMVVYFYRVPCDDDWRTLRAAAEAGATRGWEQSPSADLEALFERIAPKSELADHVVLQRPGTWLSRLAPGCYGVGAFADLDRDYRYQDEPMLSPMSSPDRLIELSLGDVREDITLSIRAGGRMAGILDPLAEQVRGGELRTHSEQLALSMRALEVVGEPADLDDPRFGRESGRLGYFQVGRFLLEVGAGIYFLEPYDPDRVPVLLIHGALGFPQEFAKLIEGLDREHYQPWVAFYPSAAPIDDVAEFYAQTLAKLRLVHGFDALAVVAHSQGGLLSRALVLREYEISADPTARLLVSIATPWGGLDSAAAGIARSPFVVPSWHDVAPNGDFIETLFAAPLPEEVDFHMLVGMTDGIVAAPSALRWEALREASQRWPLPFGHTDILDSPHTAQLVGELLDGTFD